MSDSLKLALVQATIHFENPVATLAHLEELILGNAIEADLLVLPEMFATGFTMQPEKYAEQMGMQGMRFMRQMAKHLKCAVVGSLSIAEGGKFFNRMVFMRPDETFSTYDKRHLFTMSGEPEKYNYGSERPTWNYKGWKIRPVICYDLRFPVWCRNDSEYDLLLAVACWPKVRIEAFDALIRSRAIENLAYLAACNITGDAGGHVYNGHSSVIDFKGRNINTISEDESIIQTEISLPDLMAFRKQFPAHLDADNFQFSNSPS